MYAIISTGGKQYKVEAGQQLEVELVGAEEGSEVALDPVLVVDGSRVLATPDQLGAASVRARVVGETKGPKIHGFVYKPKSNQRRRFGHRQRYSLLEITDITAGANNREAGTPPSSERSPSGPAPQAS